MLIFKIENEMGVRFCDTLPEAFCANFVCVWRENLYLVLSLLSAVHRESGAISILQKSGDHLSLGDWEVTL